MLTGNLEKIAEHGRRADGIVKSMLAHSRGGSGERQTVDINSLVGESLNLAYHGAPHAANKRNEANDPTFKPSLKVTTRDLGAEVEIRVRDNGTGIPSEIRDKLF